MIQMIKKNIPTLRPGPLVGWPVCYIERINAAAKAAAFAAAID